MKAFLFFAISALVTPAGANYSSVIYEQGSHHKVTLYTFNLESSTKEGLEETHGVYKDPSGEIVVEDRAQLKGSQLLRYEIDQKQIKMKGLIEVKEGQVFFTKTDADGKSTTKSEKLGETLVVNANFQKFVQDHWEEISKGKTVPLRFGVWDRQETVGFEIFKIGEDKVGDRPALQLKMKPSSFLIAALVKPLIFSFSTDGAHLLESLGRVTPKRKEGSNFKDLDAEVVYSD